MKLASLLDSETIICNLDGKSRREVLDALLASLEEETDSLDHASIIAALDEREKLSSVVTSPEVAFPHARISGLKDFYIAIGTAPEGIDYGGEKVRFITLFLIREDATNLYLKTMAAMARMLSDREMLEKLINAGSAEKLLDMVAATGIEVEPTIRADDIMESGFPSLSPGQSLKDAADLFVDSGWPVLPVVDVSGLYQGVVLSSSLLKVGLPSYLKEMGSVRFMADYEPFETLLRQESTLTVKEAMTTEIKTYMDHTPVIQIAIGLVNTGAPIAPILDPQGKLVGTISPADFINRILRA